MTSTIENGGDYDVVGSIRPTFLPLALKKSSFFPTLPGTPEHGGLYDSMVEITNRDVTKWEMFTPTGYDVNEISYYNSESYRSDVFIPQKEPCQDKNTVTKPPCVDNTMKKKRGLCPKWESKEEDKETQCCSQWLRSYIGKLWVKAPVDHSIEIPSKPKQLTILERELTFKQISPKHLRRLSKKQRHSATSQFIYSAFLGSEDTVIELREERHDDVIYSITVRKDGSLPRSTSAPKLLSDVDVTKEKNTSKQIKGATLEFMVRRLARVFVGDSNDVNFLNVFLTTYRTFASPEELFNNLYDEYMKLKSESTSKNISVLKSIAKVLRAWLERYSLDDFRDDIDNKLLRRLLALARIHDDVINQNDLVYNDKSPRRRPVSPLSPRKNGLMYGTCFAEYVAAKLVVAGKNKKDSKAVSSPMPSPSHNQDSSLDVLEEGSTLNSLSAKLLLSTLSSRYVATQLTVIAAKLFHRVQPHHCLAAVASSKNRSHTVRATIDQFNKVVFCVVGTILCPSLKPSQRTKLLTLWIEVAQECRELKNFSSLHAIVSSLQTHALHRLKRSWMSVPHSHIDLLKELAEINMKDLILKVGTAKVNTEDSAITRVRKEAIIRREKDNASGIMHGTVPYLGSFLTDLTYLDSARPDFLEEGLINFEKRRKEFELLAQLQLWQASCRSYQNLESESQFLEWFKSITVLTEEQTFQLSELIEPQPIASPVRRTLTQMIHSERESKSPVTPSSQWNTKKNENGACAKGNKTSQSFNGRISTVLSTPGAQESVVKIRLIRNKVKSSEDVVTDGKQKHSKENVAESSCEYKTITISSDERRAAVIRKSLDAYMLDVEANLKRFSLVQVLQDSSKEIQIPDTANVFYAMNKSDDEPTLVLLEEGAQIPHKVKRHQSAPIRPKKKNHRKNHSISFMTEPESGRSSPMSNVASPMKSLYRQIAFGSMALVSGGSYSLSDARRTSDSDGGEVASVSGIVLTNSRCGDEVDGGHDKEMCRKRDRKMRIYSSTPSSPRSTRCYSADFARSVVLPTRKNTNLSAEHAKLSKSAPCSPRQGRKSTAEVDTSGEKAGDAITAIDKIDEWPGHATSTYSRSSTWSSRRTMRHPKKTRSVSTFYLNKTTPSLTEDCSELQSPETPTSRSKFYVDILSELPPTGTDKQKNNSTPIFYNRSFSSYTLPPRLSPDFSGYDYDVRAPLRSSVSLDAKRGEVPLFKLEEPDVRHSISFTSISSNHSTPEVGEHSDSGSGICFVAPSNEDSVFSEHIPETLSLKSVKRNDAHADRPNYLINAPIIKIHSASPNNLLDQNESGFFDNCADGSNPGGDTSDTDSLTTQNNDVENEIDYSTYL